MSDTDTTTEVGPMGQQMATMLADKVLAAIEEFPVSTDAEKLGIARLVIARIAASTGANE